MPISLAHKLARLLVPWALLGVFLSCIFGEGWIFDLALAAQGFGYGLALVGLLTGRGGKLANAASSFLVLNAAAWVAFWVWITGRATQSWTKVSYSAPMPTPKGGRTTYAEPVHVGGPSSR